jgi:hypothetical protein
MGILDQAVIPVKKKTMKQFIKKIFGIKDPEPVVKQEPVKLSPKEQATANKEPWVAVLDTHVNKDNIRNGFFELDWNEYFVLQLRASGYNGETDEAIVDQWFSELCRNVGAADGIDMERRGSGFINVNNLGNGRTEVS